MDPATSDTARVTEPMPLLAYVVEAWAVAATLAPALIARFFLSQ
jgi:hypothetical protein